LNATVRVALKCSLTHNVVSDAKLTNCVGIVPSRGLSEMDLKSLVSQVVLFDRSYRVSNDFALANSVGIVPEMLLLFAKL